MSKHDCKACGHDMRLPPINFRRMEWILKLFAKIADADQQWVVDRLSTDVAGRMSQPKKSEHPFRRKPKPKRFYYQTSKS